MHRWDRVKIICQLFEICQIKKQFKRTTATPFYSCRIYLQNLESLTKMLLPTCLIPKKIKAGQSWVFFSLPLSFLNSLRNITECLFKTSFATCKGILETNHRIIFPTYTWQFSNIIRHILLHRVWHKRSVPLSSVYQVACIRYCIYFDRKHRVFFILCSLFSDSGGRSQGIFIVLVELISWPQRVNTEEDTGRGRPESRL